MKNNLTILIAMVLLSSFSVAKKKQEVLVGFGNDIEYKKVIVIKGENVNEIMKSAQSAIKEMNNEDSKEFIGAISFLIKKAIIKEKSTLILRKLTNQDINEIKVEVLRGKTVVDLIEEANKIMEQEEKLKKKLENEK